MAVTQPILRLVRDDDDLPPLVNPIDNIAEADALRNEVHVLTAELNHLRKSGETLSYHMSRLDEELRLAARLQQDFLPKALPQVGRVHFHAFFRPAGYVSGDFYDVMRLDENHVGFYIADAVGHGVPAALLTMFIKHALITKQIVPGSYRLLPPDETLGRLNKTLLEQDLSAATFATALYATINTQTLNLTFARAGHPHPILLRANGETEILESEGGLLGIFAEETFEPRQYQLNPGDRLVLYTDGIEVSFKDDATEGSQRWRQELYARRNLPAKTLLEEFGQLIDDEYGSSRPKDDLTILVMEIR